MRVEEGTSRLSDHTRNEADASDDEKKRAEEPVPYERPSWRDALTRLLISHVEPARPRNDETPDKDHPDPHDRRHIHLTTTDPARQLGYSYARHREN